MHMYRPFSFQVILVYSWAQYAPLTKGDYTYPAWANAVGWGIALTAILSVPVVALYQIIRKVFVEFKGQPFGQVICLILHSVRFDKTFFKNRCIYPKIAFIRIAFKRIPLFLFLLNGNILPTQKIT